MQEFRTPGAPAWAATGCCVVVAKSNGPLGNERWKPMLQTLLAERFRLQVKLESTNGPVGLPAVGRVGKPPGN